MIRKYIVHSLFVLAFLLTPMLVLGQEDATKAQQEEIAKCDSFKAEIDRHYHEIKRLQHSLNKSMDELDKAYKKMEASQSSLASSSGDGWSLGQILWVIVGVVVGVVVGPWVKAKLDYWFRKDQSNAPKDNSVQEGPASEQVTKLEEQSTQHSSSTTKNVSASSDDQAPQESPVETASASSDDQASQESPVETAPASSVAQAPQESSVETASVSSVAQASQASSVETAPAPAPSKSYYFEVALPSAEQGRLQVTPPSSYNFVIAEDGSFDLAPGLSDEQKLNLIRSKANTGLIIIEGFGDKIRVESKGQLNINQEDMKWVLKTPLRLKKFE